MLTRSAAAAEADARLAERRQPPADPRGVRLATVAPSTYDASARTVEVVLSAGARVRRWGYIEELEISAEAIDLTRVAAGLCPLLDSHNQYEIGSVLGTVTDARIEEGRLIGVLRFGETDAAKIAEGMVARGELRGVSIGYSVTAWTIIEADPEGGRDTWRASRWELLEASFVPVPADAQAGVRSAVSSAGAHGASADPQEDDMLTRSQGGATAPAQTTQDSNAAGDPQRSQAAAPPSGQTAQRSEPAPSGAPAPAAGGANVVRFGPTEALDFMDQARAFGIEDQARGLVSQNERGEVGAEAARSALLRAAAERQRTQTSTVPAGAGARAGDEREASRAGIVDALAARALRAQPTEAGRPYMGVRLLELAAERAGLSRNERDPVTILRAAHTTSDFPIIMEAAGNRILRDRYAAAVPTFRAIARQRDLRDFRPTKLLDIGDFPTLLPYQEDGEIKAGTINEGREQVTLGSFGRILRLTRQAIVNDDLNAFDDVFGSIGRMIARFENNTFYAVKNSNGGNGPKMADGKTLFHADHGNLAATGAAPSIATLGTARAAVRKHKDIDGNVMNLAPRTLLVGPDVETTAEQITASISPAVSGEVNPFSGKLQVVAEGAIAGNSWEVYADPADAPIWSYGYLADAPGPRAMTEESFNVDGMGFRVIMDFYVGAIDTRGAFRNPGA